jgi:hypothetical protein
MASGRIGPRIPLPDSKAALLASAELGKQVAALLETETPVQGVTMGTVRPELVKIAVVTRLGPRNLESFPHRRLGHAGQGGVTMPGKGRVETRGYTAAEAAAFGIAGWASLRSVGPARPDHARCFSE